jgi:hypothetical protein
MGQAGGQLGVGLAGGLIGGFTPLGASGGFLIGSIIGGLLFPPEGPDDIFQEGPRLGDLTVSSSAYGAPINIGYGTMRVAGNMIWSTGLEEVRTSTTTESDSGGKGGAPDGPSTTNTTYSYFSSFAIAFAEGVADRYVKIYADSKLIYDASATGYDTVRAGFNFRFYKGTETQLQDPLILADKGADAPAYRGLTYIVFDRIPLASFGNRIPNITAVITFEGVDEFPEDLSVELTGSPPIATNINPVGIAIDYDRGVMYGSTFTADENTGGISVYDLRTFQEIRQQTAFSVTGTAENIGTSLTVLPSGNLYTIAGVSANSEPVILINPDTLQEINRFGVTSGNLNMDEIDWENINSNGMNSWISLYGLEGRENYIFAASIFSSVGIIKEDGMNYVWDSDIEGDIFSSRNHCLCDGNVGIGKGEGWWAHGANYGTGGSTDDLNISNIIVEQQAGFDIIGGPGLTHGVTKADFTISIADLKAKGYPSSHTTINGVAGIVRDPVDNTIIWSIVGPSSTRYCFKWDQVLGVLWLTDITGFTTASATQPGLFNKSRMGGGTIGFGTGSEGIMLDTASGEIIFQSNNPPEWNETMANSGAWDSWNGSLTGPTALTQEAQRMWFDRHSGVGTTVEQIVKDITNRVGLTNADRDTSDLTPMLIPGYVLTRRLTARAAIEPLARFFLFEGTEIDDQLAFIAKGQASVASITESDLGMVSAEKGEFWQEKRQQEVELPETFSIVYSDPTNDYQQNIHAAKRIVLPAPTMRSKNKSGFTIAAALLTNDVKQTAEKLLYSSWVERSSYTFHLPWKYLDLVPTDVITVTMDSGNVFRTRLVKEDVGLDLVMRMSGISETLAQFSSTVVGDSGTIPQQQLPSSSATKGFILDIPLLRDQDDIQRVLTGLYAFAGGFGQPGWEAAFIFKSIDGTTYAEQTRVTGEMAYGSTKNALPDTTTPHQTDEINTLNVFMTAGDDQLVSITQLQMLNGGNPALLFNASNNNFEIIQFRDVTANDDGSFTLGGLIRGQRGTEVNTGLRESGETFLLLQPSAGERFPLALTEISNVRFYKAVGRGQLFEDVDPTTLATVGRDLKPYMPAHMQADEDASANIDFSWVRQSRIGAELIDSFGDIPVAEDSVEYELEIFLTPGASTPIRTVTGLSTESYEYTSANQISDGFGSVPSDITVKIYQISGQVGRGFSIKQTIPVTPF